MDTYHKNRRETKNSCQNCNKYFTVDEQIY
ncbi:hypothetical protein EA138_10845 [Anoxybacillus flavithermus]|uniref:Uncharacterized protein n=1 Tax=Anoxybacillus flavithermus TaxID=33934 RepID=A0AAX1ZYU8_9BACL|nr:hypothetical protein EA138_10845 [Anoxybacillus flavithermus]